MEVHEAVIPYSRPDTFHFYTFGDKHDGTKHSSDTEFLKIVKKIKEDPLARWVDMGDKMECIAPSDPRWDGGVIEDWVDPDDVALTEANHYMSLVQPIRDKCLGLVLGNHEQKMCKHYHIDIHKYICERLNVTNLGYTAFLKLLFRRGKVHSESHEVLCYLTHGSGCAITKGAKNNRLERIMDNFAADLYAHGHVHDIITNTKAYLTLDANNNIRQRVKIGAMTGCFFRTYTQNVKASYGEMCNYPPVIMGCPVFSITPDKGILQVQG